MFFVSVRKSVLRAYIQMKCYANGCQILICTRDGLASGSFIKEKLITAAVSCKEAISDKYGKVDDVNAGIDESEAYLSQKTGQRVINIEVVGMKKIGDLQRLVI